ncbi:hypothetical protein M2206_008970 [Bradyrhizobium elkanii]|nr:hypothetical protein [Bradyrhizobium elkanii]MCS3575954.1 hypothetical protein [Bradyrhizobium elkanii]GEC59615.1 hypothetical protein BEL01nite_86580 [Bradyrhizobium elkanii]
MRTRFGNIGSLLIAALASIACAPAYAEDAGPIGASTAAGIMPAAQMAQDVWYHKATLTIPGWKRAEDWQVEINKRAPAGFYAAIYKGPGHNDCVPLVRYAF